MGEQKARLFFVFDDKELTADEADELSRDQINRVFRSLDSEFDIKHSYDSRDISMHPDPEYDIKLNLASSDIDEYETSDVRTFLLRVFNEYHNGDHALDHIQPTPV